jgi:ribulose kinase
MSSESYYIGVDVGTGSVRASIFKGDGAVLSSSTQETITYRDPHDHRIFEQSTDNIWSGASTAIKEVLAESKIPASAVKGLGFDATCSLAATDINGDPIVVTGDDTLGHVGERNIVLWADHRSEKEAEHINSFGSVVLDYVGGSISVRPLPLPAQPESHTSCSSRWKCRRSSGSRGA